MPSGYPSPTDRKPTRRAGLLALGLLGLFAGLAGCAVGPDWVGVGVDLPQSYRRDPTPTHPRSDLTRWWVGFRDPQLDRLIVDAVAGNLDVAAAKARIREARALRHEEVGGLFPALEGSSSAIRSKTGTSAGGTGAVGSLYRGGFDAAWEIDLFGGQSRSVEAATRGLEAADADLEAVLLTLVGDVASNYVELRGHQARIALARRTAAAQREIAGLTRSKFDAGSSSEVDVAKATALAASTEAGIPSLEISRAVAVHRLGVLIGRAPGDVALRLEHSRGIPAQRTTLRPGLPAELLSRRPDVAAAERRLARATAEIGVAEAALYPSVSLTGSLSTTARRTGDLGKGSTIGWSWGPKLTVPIFAGGRLIAAVDVADARRDEAHVAFRAAVLVALQDVENALVSLTQERLRHRRLSEATTSHRRAAALSRSLWRTGSSSFLDVLDAERSLHSAEDALIQSRVALSTDAIALAKALGGGWDDHVVVDRPEVVDVATGPHLRSPP